MKKTVSILLLAGIVCFLLTACSTRNNGSESKPPFTVAWDLENADYSIEEIDGKQCLVFRDISLYENIGQMQRADISFKSISDFLTRVTKGALEDWEKQIIASCFPRDERGNIVICDFANLYIPMLPKDATVTGVIWNGPTYSFQFQNTDGSYGILHYLRPEEFQQKFQDDYTNLFEREQITVTGTEKIDERNAEATYYETSAGQLKNIRYTLENQETTIYIDETYRLNMNMDGLARSDKVPSSINIFYRSDAVGYIVELYNLSERPAVDWIKSLRLSPIVPLSK